MLFKMKKIFFTAWALSCMSILSFGQDLITKKNGEDIKAKVTEVTLSEIKYKKFENLEGPIYSLLIKDVLIIRYENGSKDLFTQDTPSISNFEQGQLDASKFYYVPKSDESLVLTTTSLLTPLVGGIAAAIESNKEIKDENLNYLNKALINNTEYKNGYKQMAIKIRKKKIYNKFLLGTGFNLAIVLFLIGQSNAGN
jgi:hypothetical protein